MSEEIKHLTGSAYILNPIANINGHLTEASQIYDANQGKNQSEINELISLSSGVSEIQEFYAVYSAPKYEGEDMKMDPNVRWVQVPSPSGEEFPAMTPKDPYLWNYEKFIQTNKTIITTEPHVAGVLGRGYKSIIRSYLVDNQSDNYPAADDSRWQPQSPPTTEENPFLWEKQEIYYSDNYDETNPDETILTLIGRIGEKGIDGTEIEYIFCFWPSKTAGPINPTPEDWEDVMSDYQTKSDYTPSFIYPEGSELTEGYSWSDDPVSVSKENPAQWICCREKKDGVWGKFSDPKLYSTYGEDGVSIKKIETWYLISNTDVLNESIKEAGNGVDSSETKDPNKWYKNSPAVNKDYRYLWKKTILTFSADIYDNPDTEIAENKTTTSISYEVIGSMGDKGIDGDSVEWIYTKTKEKDTPPERIVAADEDKDFQESDYVPHPRYSDLYDEEGNLIENSEWKDYDYYWSDDIQSVDKDYIYGWRSQRKKINGTWGNFSKPVLILEKAVDGVSPNAAFKSIVFIRSASQPDTPTGGDYNNPVPNGWSDGIPEGTDTLYSSTRIFSSDGELPQQENWTDPKVMSDTTELKIIYCGREEYTLPTIENINPSDSDWEEIAKNKGWYNKPNDIPLDENKTDTTPIWMAISQSVNNLWSEWEVSRIKGERGSDGTSIKVSGQYDDLSTFKLFWAKEVRPDEITGETIVEKWYSPEEKGYTSDACFVVEGKLWVWDGSDEWIDVGQFTGNPGKTYYLHVIYAKSAVVEEDRISVSLDNLTNSNGTVPGKYIATWTDDKQGISSITQEFLNSLFWSKWMGDDGYGYEYIYKLTKEDQSVDLPSVPDDWETNEDYQKPDLVPEAEGWSDNPLSVSKDFPYCWQAYRMRVDGVWSKWKGHSNSPYAALWSKFGKDGLTLFSKSWYCIAPQDATKDSVKNYPIPTKNKDGKWEVEDEGGVKREIAEGAAEYWWENSPTVTDSYPNLWKRTESEYKEFGIDNTETIEGQTVYELIGSKGSKGVDGNDIQWAFKLTKSFETPTSIIEGDNWPKDDVNNQTAGEWTDDALDVSQEYPYQWVIKRSKIDGVWTDWGTKVIGEDNQYYYKATLNNSFGNYITEVKSYYTVSNENEIGKITPNKSDYTSHEGFEAALLKDDKWKVGNGETLTTTPINDKLYELSIYIFSDKTYSISGPIIKAQWLGDNIQSTVFCRSNSTPGRPTGGSYEKPYPTNKENNKPIWSDGIPDRYIKNENDEITDTLPSTVWSSTAVFKTTDTDIENGPTGGWSEPIQLTDTSSLRIRYSNLEELPKNDNNDIIYPEEADSEYWTLKPSEDTVWMATQYFSYGEWNDWEFLKVKGETGKDGAKPNLFLNSGFDNEEGPLSNWTVEEKGSEGYDILKNCGEQGVNGINGTYDLSYDITDRILPGETYTISFRLSFLNNSSVKIDLSELISSWDNLLSFSSESLSGNKDEENLFLIPKENQFVNKKVFFTFKTPETLGTDEKLIFKLVSNNDGYGYTTHSLKLENSPYVTDYCRAQDDLRGKNGNPGINGESAVYADLDNEIDSIPLTSSGYASSLTPVKTNVWISKGINKQEISYLKVKVGDDEYVYEAEGTTTTSTTTSAPTETEPTENKIWYSLECTEKKDYSYEFTITPKDTNTKIPEKTEFNIILGYYENLELKTFNLYFTVNGIKPGLSPKSNLLINSNFDLYDGNKLKGWEILNGKVVEKSFNGFNSYQYTTAVANNFLSTTTPKLEAELFYTLSFYYKNTTTSILTDTFNVTFIGGAGKISDEIISTDNNNIISGNNRSSYFKSSSSWRKVSISFKTAVSGTIEFKFYKPTITSSISISQPKLESGEYSTPYTKNQNDLIGPVGPAGKSGRNMYPAGNWDEDVEYKIENNSVPFVFYSQNYYILTVGEGETVKGMKPNEHPDKWGIFEYTPFQFSEFLMANWAKFGGTNGAVFYDRYLYSQKGYTNDGIDDYYWNHKDKMFDIDDNGNLYLTDTFTPKLHLDFYNGLANLSCLCEPYITPQESSDEPGVIRISPESGFNIKIPCNCPSSGSDMGIAPPMLHPIVVLPNLDDVNQSKWAFDGAHVTILFEPGGQKYGELSGPYASRIDKQNVFLLVCTDLSTSPTGKGIGVPSSTYDQNLIFCNNKRGKYIILSPGSMVKLKVNVVKNDNGTKYLHWIIENSGAIKEESVNIYNTDKSSLNKPTQIEDSIVPGNISLDGTPKINGGAGDSVVQFYGADYPDYVNLATTTLPNAWGLMFYSGPDGFCPKNILFSRQLDDNNQRLEDDYYKYHYRVLDFIGKEGSYGSTLYPPDQANNFDVSPLI